MIDGLKQHGDMREQFVWCVKFQLKVNTEPWGESVLAETAMKAMELAMRWHNEDPALTPMLTEAHTMSVICEGTVIVEA